MNQAFIDEMKQRLEEEKVMVQKELQGISRPDVGDHVIGKRAATFPDYGNDALYEETESPAEVAEYSVNVNVTGHLEDRLAQIDEALQRIAQGKYGICVKTGDTISEERLRANPAAATCIDAAKSHT